MPIPKRPDILSMPAVDAATVTPGASALSGGVCKALWVGGAGVVVITTLEGTTLSLTVQAGQVVPIMCSHVLATDGASPATTTTATGIVALY